MFQIGDYVCYPMHGVGTVESIEEQTVLGETSKYYLLRFTYNRMTAMIPVSNADAVGLRSLSSYDECMEAIRFLQDDSTLVESDNWNQRYRENLDKLRNGNIFDVAHVVKALMKRDKEKGLSAGERKMYQTARQVLVAELSISTKIENDVLMSLVGAE